MIMIYPMFALFMLTVVIGFSMGAARLKSVKAKEIDPRYFKLLSGYTPPDYVTKLTNNYSNLLEAPVLFYIWGVLLVVLNNTNDMSLILAWSYVVLRAVHSFIHITYNNPKHRFYVFLASFLVLIAMWIQLVVLISQ